mmetsp:Transcript_56622/g.184172  ORF Transcript_56622/g.184172 Transcript_56622/m.184172 type:complete len:81 (-) Transcript_56622:446-688(-)
MTGETAKRANDSHRMLVAMAEMEEQFLRDFFSMGASSCRPSAAEFDETRPEHAVASGFHPVLSRHLSQRSPRSMKVLQNA